MVLGSMLTPSRPVPSPKSRNPDINGLQWFMGMVNHLWKFLPRLADLSEPLRQLLRKDSSWVWEEPQQKAFQQIKEALVSPEVLAQYDTNRPTIVSAEVSSTGIGAVLAQVQGNKNAARSAMHPGL